MFDNSPLTPFTIKVVNKLLYHQRRVRTLRNPVDDVSDRMLTHTELCEMLDREPSQAYRLKAPLQRIEEWCTINNWPNLTTLVVEPEEREKATPQQTPPQDLLQCLTSVDYPMFVR